MESNSSYENRSRGDSSAIPLSQRVFLVLFVVASTLTVISAALRWDQLRGSRRFESVVWWFYTGNEYNLPSWFSSGMWLIMGLVSLLMIAYANTRRFQWAFLGVVALVASLDEFTQLHEKLTAVGLLMPGENAHRIPWTIPGAVIAIVVALSIITLVLQLPPRNRNAMLLGGALFLLGALGFEKLGAYLWVSERHGLYEVAQLIEEWLEMVGLALSLASVVGMVEWTRTKEGFVSRFRGYRADQNHATG